MNPEVIGIIGSSIVLISMCFKPYKFFGNMMMRGFNLLGSLVYIYYGLLISAPSVILLNVILTFVNLFYIWKALKYKKRKNQEKIVDI